MSTTGDPREPRRPGIEPGFLDSGDDGYDEDAPEFLVSEDDDKWAEFAPTDTPPAGFAAAPPESLPTPPAAVPAPPSDPVPFPPPPPPAAETGGRRGWFRRPPPPPPPPPGPAPAVGPTPADEPLFGEEPLPAALQLTPDPSLPPAPPEDEPAAATGQTPAARWRSEAGDYEDEGWEEITAEFRALQAEEDEEVALAGRMPEEPFVTDDIEPEAASVTGTRAGAGRATSRNEAAAVATGVAFGLLALLLIKAGRPLYFLLVLAVVMLALVEFYTGLRRARFKPAAAPGLLGALVILIGTYRQGTEALGFGLSMVVVFTLLWFLLGVIKGNQVANLGSTLLGVLYVAFLGCYAVLILGLPDWQGVTIAYLALTIASDVGAYFVGSRYGHHRVLPRVSPTKSVEGLVGGAVLAAVVGVVVVRGIHPFALGSALALALLVSVAAPLGDLYESMIKRALSVKDLGSILPGHGGIIDRIDSLLLVLPVTFYFLRWVVY